MNIGFIFFDRVRNYYINLIGLHLGFFSFAIAYHLENTPRGRLSFAGDLHFWKWSKYFYIILVPCRTTGGK
jgi:hypothetical protein